MSTLILAFPKLCIVINQQLCYWNILIIAPSGINKLPSQIPVSALLLNSAAFRGQLLFYHIIPWCCLLCCAA